jgi:hypothetical protein
MYKAEFLKRYNIRNCEEFSRFADDTYINMLSYGLGKTEMIQVPLYLYTYNVNSVTNQNGGKDYWSNVVPKFLRCIEKTTEIIVQYKPIEEIEHLSGTLSYIRTVIEERGNTEEIALYNSLLNNFVKIGATFDDSAYLH